MRRSISITSLVSVATFFLATPPLGAGAPDSRASDVRRVHADLLFREGHVLEADAEYRAAIDLDQRNALAIYGSARILGAKGFRARRAALVRTAHALAPDDEEIGRAVDALEERHEAELESPYRHYQLPYRIRPDGKGSFGAGLAISVHGVKSELRFDTGAGGVTVSTEFALKARIQSVGRSRSWGIGSDRETKAWLGYADELHIGDLAFKNVTVNVVEKRSLGQFSGLLGSDLFKRFLVKVDFSNHSIALDPLFGPPWDGYTPVDAYTGTETKPFTPILEFRHYLLIPTTVSEAEKSDAGSGLFLIDTGAGFNSLATNLARSITTVRYNHHMSVQGVSGKVKMLYEAERVVLRFAGFREEFTRLAAFDLPNISSSAGVEVSGILGMPVLATFGSITIDYRDAGILFK